MIYLVTGQSQLFESDVYKIMTIEESLNMLNSWGRIQYDSETSGLDPHLANILCIQFGNKKAGHQIVVDTTTIDVTVYKEILENKPIIGQNLKFDLQFLYNYSIIPRKVYDTMIVEQLLYLGYPPESVSGIGYSLTSMAKRYLNVDISKEIRGDIIWRGLDTAVIKYAAGDVTYLEDIMESQLVACREKDCLVGAKLECDFVPVIAYLEWCGIRLSEERWRKKMLKDEANRIKYKQELDTFLINKGDPRFFTVNLQGDLWSGFDTDPVCTVNWDSPAQVTKVAKFLGFDTTVEDKKTGKYKDSVLEDHLKRQKGIDDEFLEIYFKYQEASKVVGTYGQSYLNAINPKTGRIHTVFRQLGASSGRMACGDSKNTNIDLARYKKLPPKEVSYPQLQNLPADEDTRSAFIPNEGNFMCSCDFSALESRLGADIYNEKSMQEEFLYGSGDTHSLVAKACFEELKDVPVKDIKKKFPKLRNKAKPINFSQQFGGSAISIASSLGCSIEEAEKIANAYNKGFPGIADFKARGSKFVKENGYILICKYTGHKLYWWDWEVWKERQASFTSQFWEEYRVIKANHDSDHPIIKKVKMHYQASSKYDRLALNSPPQGTGIIILKDAMINFFDWLVKNNLFNIVLLCNLVHDEAVIEYPKNMPEVANILKETMEASASKYCKSLPIPAEASVGDHWIH